ncbi:DUF7738 domain-containing protein [Ferruginibacter sp.]|nr:hypothetical protein [Ferruginibacter sp.]
MKQLLTLTAFLFTCVLSFAQPSAKKISVVIKDGKFSIAKTNVTESWRQDAVSIELGINDRRRAGMNITHTYDDFGIVLFEKTQNKVGSGELSEVQFYIAQGDTNAVSPKGFFVGKMKIEKLKISSDLSWQNVKEKLKDYKQTDSYIEHNYRLSNKGLYIYFQFNKEETTLLKISVGKDQRTNN